MQQDMKQNVFDRVVFSSKANSSLVEKLMHDSFPLYLSATRDSGGSFTDAERSHEDGAGLIQTEPAEIESLPNRTESVLQSQTESLQSEPGPVLPNGVQEETGLQHNLPVHEHREAADDKHRETVHGGGTVGVADISSEAGCSNVGLLHDPPVHEAANDGGVVSAPDINSEAGCSKVKDSEATDNLSTEDLLESLEALQDENMKTFEELVEKLAEMAPEPSPGQQLQLSVDSSAFKNMYSQSLPSHYRTGSGFLSEEGRSVSPSSRSYHNRSQSGDYILNPDRTESDV